MEIIEVRDDSQKKELLDYLPNVIWGESQVLTKAIKNDEIDEKLGKDAKIFYAKEDGEVMGFFTLVNQDYIPLPQYDRFIAMIYVDPKYRNRGYSREFIKFAEEASGVDTIHLFTKIKGLYEKMGYTLIEELVGYIHGIDYLYEKKLR